MKGDSVELTVIMIVISAFMSGIAIGEGLTEGAIASGFACLLNIFCLISKIEDIEQKQTKKRNSYFTRKQNKA